jgi:hypothetical protein
MGRCTGPSSAANANGHGASLELTQEEEALFEEDDLDDEELDALERHLTQATVK